MTKKDIVRLICERANRQRLVKDKLSQQAVKEIVQWTLDSIIDALVQEGRIELRKFGIFEVKQRKPRIARNPRTNEKVEVGPRCVVVFQAGKEMEERVRREGRPAPRRTRAPRNAAAAPSSETAEDAEALAVGGSAT
ncbi:MAG: HU family DNA-binding protein [Thermogemmata sp.]|uniref:Integration host factor subunit beta n=1 Tax=Thermogemmata fonticola TaxID=2755323 RepID=A0A7V9AAE7_9BACT|nr:HU family DNA-binding protein [Thermogemmata fonticola]MBA2224973.1 integration host factor subunit beta [Thermogemmata fonticola]